MTDPRPTDDTRLPDTRLIVSLDTPTAAAARNLVRVLGREVGFYKVGLGLLADGGLDLATELKSAGLRVFLDLKLFDIPATIAASVRGLAAAGLDFLTVHGDPYVVAAAAEGRGASPMRILAVTILTSLDRADLDSALIAPGALAALALERADRALRAGADGVIASPLEAAAIRALPAAAGKLIVTPGVRPAGEPAQDQKRIATPIEALRAGSDYLVIGRPIWAAPDPAAAARAILATMAAA